MHRKWIFLIADIEIGTFGKNGNQNFGQKLRNSDSGIQVSVRAFPIHTYTEKKEERTKENICLSESLWTVRIQFITVK